MIHCKYNVNIRGLVSRNLLERARSVGPNIYYSARLGNGNESEKSEEQNAECERKSARQQFNLFLSHRNRPFHMIVHI